MHGGPLPVGLASSREVAWNNFVWPEVTASLIKSSTISGPPSAAPRINNNHSAVAAASPGHKDARAQGHKDIGGGGAASASVAGSRYSAAGGSSAAARPATASAVTKTSAAGMDSSRKYLFSKGAGYDNLIRPASIAYKLCVAFVPGSA